MPSRNSRCRPASIPAEFGHQATQINVLTKSGGNSYHGALFDFVRNDKFDAVPYAFGTVHPEQVAVQVERLRLRNRWPGPHSEDLQRPEPAVLHGQRRVEDAALRTARRTIPLPTAAEEAGNLGALSATIYDPTTGGATGADQDPVPRQRDSHQPPRSDLAEVSELLRRRRAAHRQQQLPVHRQRSQQPRRLHPAHGFRGILQVAVDRPL